MILNKKIPSLRHGNLEWLDFSHYTRIFSFDHGFNWLIEIADTESFSDVLLDEALPKTIRTQLKVGPLKLMVINSFEGFHSIVEFLYQRLVIDFGIPETKIVFFSESSNILTTVNNCASTFNKKPIKTYWTRISENRMAIYALQTPPNIQKRITSKKFLCLNRRWRPHRPTFVGLLAVKKLLELGHVSFSLNFENYNWDNTFDWLLELNHSNIEVYDLLKENENAIRNIPQLKIDVDNFEDSTTLISANPNLDGYYNETYFSVVTETNFYQNPPMEYGIFFSEKTFKPILYQHPFLMLAVPNTLATLRSIGYKTFSPYIDESYDEEKDDATRMLMVLKETERLAKLSPEEVEQFIVACQPICEHNFQLLSTRNKIGTTVVALN